MCRLFAMLGDEIIDPTLVEMWLNEFGKLAETGDTLTKNKRGHKDGWGLGYYHDTRAVTEVYRIGCHDSADASKSKDYAKAISRVESSKIFAHIRRTKYRETIGIKSQPFKRRRFDKYWLFIHNGGIDKNLTTGEPYAPNNLRELDSEKLFRDILRTIRAPDIISMVDGIRGAIIRIRNQYEFSALNFILSDGIFTHVYREYSESDKTSIRRYRSYYTLWWHRDYERNMVIICSQPLTHTGWQELPNRTLLSIDRHMNIVSIKVDG